MARRADTMSKLYIIRNRRRDAYLLSIGHGLTDDRRKAYHFTWEQIVEGGLEHMFSRFRSLRLQEVIE